MSDAYVVLFTGQRMSFLCHHKALITLKECVGFINLYGVTKFNKGENISRNCEALVETNM